jgi:hypothetical protein
VLEGIQRRATSQVAVRTVWLSVHILYWWFRTIIKLKTKTFLANRDIVLTETTRRCERDELFWEQAALVGRCRFGLAAVVAARISNLDPCGGWKLKLSNQAIESSYKMEAEAIRAKREGGDPRSANPAPL